jgi:hypothetical protein
MDNKFTSSDTRKSPNTSLSSPGPYLAKVVSHLDPTYMGILEVQLMHESGNNPLEEGQLHYVQYLSPFAGQTNLLHVKQEDTYASTQKSYGMWMIPPDPGVIVMCIFVDGDPRKGYWFGCVQDTNINFMMPGLAATELATDKKTGKTRVPVADYNKVVNEGTSENNLTQIIKPASPLEKTLDDQGLLEDDARGITTSSARREVPSAVFGISTPGPIDKQGPKGEYGKKQWRIKDKPVNRLLGSTFVMDDGDDKWERKTTPSEGPPEYASVEAGETGLRDRPHNELIRLRTRTGHQILLHNSEDLIYIGNARGTAWIELTSDGKIDIFSADSINIHTKQDFNFFADRDFNLEIGRNFNIKVEKELHLETNTEKRIVNSTQDINVIGNVKKIYEGTYQREVFKTTDFKFIGNVTERIDANHRTKTAGTSTNFVMGAHSLKIKGARSLTVEGSNLIFVGGSSIQTTKGSFNLSTTGSNNFTTSATTNIRSGSAHIETAPVIHMNGPGAASAASISALPDYKLPITIPIPVPLKTHKLPGHTGSVEFDSILRRVTTREPYPHHENLDPKKFKPDNLDRDVKKRYENDREDGRKDGKDNEP